MELQEFKQNSILLELISGMDVKKNADSAIFTVNLIKKTDRVPRLLQSSISLVELTKKGHLESDVQLLLKKKYVHEVSNEKYVLTIKGILKAASLLNSKNKTEDVLYEDFIEKLFESRFGLLKGKEKMLSSFERTWLLSILFLNCFDESLAIDVLFDKDNKKTFITLFNKVGIFLQSNNYLHEFKLLSENDKEENLRRQIIKIDRKIEKLTFSKKRNCFYVKLSSEQDKKVTLLNIFKKIFIKVDGTPTTIYDSEKIRDFMHECQPFFFKVKRRKINDITPDLIVDETLNFLA